MLLIVWALAFLAGIVLLFWAKSLSLRYNAWTTAFRERNRQINPPPTPEMRELNTRIMTGMFRVTGAILIVSSMFVMLANMKAN